MKSLRLICLSVLLLCGKASAISITLEYTNPLDPFFTPTARATLLQAANDLSSAITTTLAPLGQDVYSGVNGSTSASVNWSLSYIDPETGGTTILPTFQLLSNEFRIFVGTRNLPASTLGVGGPGGAGLSFSGSGTGSKWITAVEMMESASNAAMPRGGPILGTLAGSSTLGGVTASYAVEYGYGIGSIAFNDLATWHTDYATLPSSGKNDFYSVALHELTHALGFGSGETWEAEVSGSNWLGGNVTSLLGSGTNVLFGDESHIASGETGHPLIDGTFHFGLLQEPAMDPTLTVGSRKYLTDLDLAFLQDMGWEVVPEPAPTALLLLAGLLASGWMTKRRSAIHP